MSTNWKELTAQLEGLLRFRTFPVGLKLFETVEEMEKVPKIRRLRHKATFCQVITQARTLGWTVGCVASDFSGGNCATITGLAVPASDLMDGTRLTGVWFKEKVDAAKHQQAIPRVPAGKFNAVALSPLATGRFDPPDLVLVNGTPAQMILLINGLQWKDYERLQFFCVGETACSDSIAQCLLSGKPALAIPCFGERRYGHVAEEELVMAIPPEMISKAIEGLKGLSAAGLRYPIPFFGTQADPTEGFRASYPNL